MLKFKNNFFLLFLPIFAIFLLGTYCVGIEPVFIGWVNVVDNATMTSNNSSSINYGDITIADSTLSDKYILKGNAINFGDKSHLISYDTVPPRCDLYIRAIKIRDGLGDPIEYNPNTSDTTLDTMWILYEGRATLDWLASAPGVWKTFAVRYTEGSTTNDYDVERVILDKSCSKDGINRYTLVDKDGKVVSPEITSEKS